MDKQSPNASAHWLQWLCFGCLALAVAVFLRVRLGSNVTPGDDAYMTFRTALNLAAGHGFAYNLGEQIYCTTTPLYALLLASISMLANSEPLHVYFSINLLFELANIVLFFVIAKRALSDTAFACIASIIYCLSWHMAVSSLLGMESPVFVFTILVALLAASSRDEKTWQVIGAIACGLSVLTRPEAAVLVLGYYLFRLLNRRQLPLFEMSITGIVVLPWVIFALSEFGTLVPHSVVGKSLGYHRDPLEALFLIGRHFIQTLLVTPLDIDALGILIFLLTLEITMYGMVVGSKKHPWLAVAHIYVVGVVILYILKNPLVMWWYLPPFEIAYILAFVAGVQALTTSVRGFSLPTAHGVTLVIACSLVFQFNTFPSLRSETESEEWTATLTLARSQTEMRQGMLRPLLSSVDREELYKKMALELTKDITDSHVVLAPEFGAFGYFTSAKMTSSIGHINPEVIQYLPSDPGKYGNNNYIPVEMVQGIKPDYVLSLDAFVRDSLGTSEWFWKNYQISKAYPSRVWGVEAVCLYERRKGENTSAAAPAGACGYSAPL